MPPMSDARNEIEEKLLSAQEGRLEILEAADVTPLTEHTR